MSTKTSAKSSHSLLQSSISTSSISSTVKSGAKAIKHGIKRGIKCLKNSANVLVWPLKHAKHALSNVSTPAISNAEDDPATAEDHATAPSIIDLSSYDEHLEALMEQLSMPTYCFFLIVFLIPFS